MQNYLSNSEVKALLKGLTSNRDNAIAVLLITTGISRSELCELTLSDIDLAKKTLTVTGHKGRMISLNVQAKEAVSKFLQERPVVQIETLFLTNKGTLQGLSSRSVDHLLRKGGEAAGIEAPVTPQLLRNTYAVKLFQAGATHKQVSKLLGITDYNTLCKYQKMAQVSSDTVLGEELVAPDISLNMQKRKEVRPLKQSSDTSLEVSEDVRSSSIEDPASQPERGVVYRDWTYTVIFLWALLVLFRFIALGVHSFEGYILAGVGVTMIVAMRFFIFTGR